MSHQVHVLHSSRSKMQMKWKKESLIRGSEYGNFQVGPLQLKRCWQNLTEIKPSDVHDGSIIISSIIFIIYNLFTHTPVKLVRMCGGVITHTWNTGPWGIFYFPQSVLYKQIELEKSSHWNIISSCHIWSVFLAACGLFNQSNHKGTNLQTCCEQATVKSCAQTW